MPPASSTCTTCSRSRSLCDAVGAGLDADGVAALRGGICGLERAACLRVDVARPPTPGACSSRRCRRPRGWLRTSAGRRRRRRRLRLRGTNVARTVFGALPSVSATAHRVPVQAPVQPTETPRRLRPRGQAGRPSREGARVSCTLPDTRCRVRGTDNLAAAGRPPPSASPGATMSGTPRRCRRSRRGNQPA